MTAVSESADIAIADAEWSPPRPNAIQQWWVLTSRGILNAYRNGEFIFCFVSPAMLAVCFYLPLRQVVDEAASIDYAQFLMPIIMLQAMAFVASSAALKSAMDGHAGVHDRFRSLPMAAVIPFLARTATIGVLLLVALAFGLISCLMIGWRPIPVDESGGGIRGALLAVLIVGAIGWALSFISDGIGMVSSSPTVTSQLVAFPTLILGMLSSGFMPLALFPEWIRGFVRNQPISQVVKAMREAMEGTATWATVKPTFWWFIGLVSIGLLLFGIAARKER
ncbi:ABC transporter permease [Gordonia iterans]